MLYRIAMWVVIALGASLEVNMIAGSRPFYYFNAALHSDETGSTEAVLELAYRLAVSDQPMPPPGVTTPGRSNTRTSAF
jgi:predicted deacylase